MKYECGALMETEVLGENVSQCQFVLLKSHTYWSEIEPVSERTATNHLNHGMAIMNWKVREKSCSWPLKLLYPNVENCRVTSLQTAIKRSSS
jgi:hypothetical protein